MIGKLPLDYGDDFQLIVSYPIWVYPILNLHCSISPLLFRFESLLKSPNVLI